VSSSSSSLRLNSVLMDQLKTTLRQFDLSDPDGEVGLTGVSYKPTNIIAM
ncbi:4173_t:CDS:1, partial [Paraglomus occultum]